MTEQVTVAHDLEPVRQTTAAACRRGLAAAAAALVGGRAAEVCAGLAAWRLGAARPFPRLTGLCWSALEPLGGGVPDGPDVAVVERALVGTPVAPDELAGAVARLRVVAGDAAAAADEPDLVSGLRRRALANAVEDFWEAAGRAAESVGAAVVADERVEAEATVAAARTRLGEIAERIEILASGVAGRAPVPVDRGDATAVPAELLDGDVTGPLLPSEGQAAQSDTAPSITDPVRALTDPMPDPPVPAPSTGPGPEPGPGPGPAPAVAARDETRPLPVVRPPVGSASPQRARGARGHEVARVPQQRRPLPPPRPVRRGAVEVKVVREHRYAPIVFLVLTVAAAAWVLAQTLAHTPASG